MFFSVLCLLCLCVRLFICALWSPAWKGLTSWLSFVVSDCEFVTFPLVSWVRCAALLTFSHQTGSEVLVINPTLLSKKTHKNTCLVITGIVEMKTAFLLWPVFLLYSCVVI